MRAFALTLICLATPSAAWTVDVDGGICVLENSQDAADLRMTFDPSGPLYSIALTTSDPWDSGPIFSMDFRGPRGQIISTTRHILDQDDRRVRVEDTGFGNVLDGLEFNSTATANLGLVSVTLDLTGAAPAIQAFRDCTVSPFA
ncbi:MAG: hypothetical protein AAF689_14665 [Pseudomonadota bacterium]